MLAYSIECTISTMSRWKVRSTNFALFALASFAAFLPSRLSVLETIDVIIQDHRWWLDLLSPSFRLECLGGLFGSGERRLIVVN